MNDDDTDLSIIECDMSQLTDADLRALCSQAGLRDMAEIEQRRRLLTPDAPADRYFRLPLGARLNGNECAAMLTSAVALAHNRKDLSPAASRLADQVLFVTTGSACLMLAELELLKEAGKQWQPQSGS